MILSDKEIIQLLKGEITEKNKALAFLFTKSKYKSPLLSFLSSKGCNKKEALDIYTDTLVQFASVVKQEKYHDIKNIAAFLKSTSYFILLSKWKKSKNQKRITTLEESPPVPIELDIDWDVKEGIKELLKSADKTCVELLKMWSYGYSMKEIMLNFDFPSESATRKRKHICMKKILLYLETNIKLKSELSEYLKK